MKKCNLRSGSALLIVLGMLTFLIVSAVGFSAYMRQGRLPSSQLRRSVAARHLVKAAMAEAIDTIDQAINDNPHPGVGERAVDGYNRNVWCNRIFIGTNDWDESSFDFANTVSPLCLEALAYIPPTLINEARYYSRLSPAAEWKSFDYGVGRYAFCAIDVSDYFDVNRLFANKRRSSAPHERISLAYLFKAGEAKSWDDDFIKKYAGRVEKEEDGERKLEIDKPLISIADLNLALNDKGGVGDIKSAFCEGLNSNGEFCKTDNDNALAKMTFVTDSLFVNSSRRLSSAFGEIYDLAYPTNQPIKSEFLSKPTEADVLSKIFKEDDIFYEKEENKATYKWFGFLGLGGMVSLYDYLDIDHDPLSLAIPTTERVPMICAIKPDLSMEFAVKKVDEPEEVVPAESDGSKRRVKKVVSYFIDTEKLSSLFDGTITVSTVFPFLSRGFEKEEEKSDTFKIDGQLKLFFSSDPMTLRTSTDKVDGEDVLHLTSKGEEELKTEYNDNTGVVSIGLDDKPIEIPKNVTKQEDVVSEPNPWLLKTEASDVISSYDKNYLLKVEYKWNQTPKKDQNGTIIAWEPSFDKLIQDVDSNGNVQDENLNLEIAATTKFPPIGKDGCKDSAFDGKNLVDKIKENGDDNLVYFNCALWFRVKNESSKKVVDMVPACLQDDITQNGAEVNDNAIVITRDKLGDSSYPLMCFNTGVSFKFSILGLEKLAKENNLKKKKITPKAVMVSDPRYNHSPEDWFTFEGNYSKDSWIEWLKNDILGKGDRDRDIFMETSDAGYLQSFYELAFLPRITDPSDDDMDGYLINNERNADKEGFYTSFNETKNSHIAWRTFDPFKHDAEAFLNAPFINEGNGFKVNPYSDSKNVLTAVFANTPLGWRYASTNEVGNVKYDNEADKFNSIYAFSEINQNKSAKVGRKDWEKIAQKFIDEIRRENKGTQTNSWENVFLENMDWDNDAENNFLGIDMSESDVKFWGVDKKFLYGFWKDCFAAKQQLFLVFVRAEPTMMGSGATGHAPPQLGGKAVALVWRDPNPPPDTSDGSDSGTDRAIPHKTRVLFYRQFE